MNVAWLAIGVLAASGYALLAFPLLQLPKSGLPSIAVLPVAVGILFLVLLIPSDYVATRAVLSILCTEIVFKWLDLARHVHTGADKISFRDYLRLMLPFPLMLVTRIEKQQARQTLPVLWWRELACLVLMTGLATAASLLSWSSPITALINNNFWREHLVRLITFLILLETVSRAVMAIERMSGYQALPLLTHPFVARTVGEFWCRYNIRVHTWLIANVFLPVGGRRHPARGVCCVFLASATLHELMFGLATSRFDGYQFAFFSLQAPAVLVQRWLDRRCGESILATIVQHTLTITWFYFSSTLFFHGVDRVFPFAYTTASCWSCMD